MSTSVSSGAPVGELKNCNGRKLILDDVDLDSLDDMSRRLRREALEAAQEEPEIATLLFNTVLAPGVRTFEDAVACAITYRLLLRPCHQMPSATGTLPNLDAGPMFCPHSLRGIIAEALHNSSDLQEAGHSMSEAVRLDALAVCDRDPAVDTLLEVVLFLKGFAALVCHRAAFYKWHMTKKMNGNRRSTTALWLQSQASAVFGLDIHPAATMGAGILLDHGTGIVIGETATVGDGCTLLHGVTLGGTGKDTGDRHPKVGRDVLIGANASLLGNIPIGDGAKIGAGSVVLRPIPAHATAVGAPAKIVGRAKEAKPGSTMDETLQSVNPLHKEPSAPTGLRHSSESTSTLDTTTSLTTIETALERVSARMESEDDISSEELEGGAEEKEEDQKVDTSNPDLAKTASTKSHKHKSKKSNDTDVCCPFRDYMRIAESAPAGTITICTLGNLLKPLGCTASQVGGVLFELDKRSLGFVKPDAFFTDRTQEIIVEKTKLPAERVALAMSNFREKWQKERTQVGVQRSSITHSAQRVSVMG